MSASNRSAQNRSAAITYRSRRAPAGIVVLVVPLLFETGMEKLCDLTVTVSCPENVRIKRLVLRDTIPAELARAIVASQLTDAEREKRAGAVLVNDGDIAKFRDEVKALYFQIEERA